MTRENRTAKGVSASDTADGTTVYDLVVAAPLAPEPDAAVVLASGTDQPAGTVEKECKTSPPEASLDPAAVMSEGQANPAASALILHSVPDLEVTATVPSRCRAGRRFGSMPVVIPAAEVTDDLIMALLNDPFLKLRPAPPYPAGSEVL